MDIKEELDAGNNEHIFDMQIKKEPELLINNDCQWTPSKFNDEEYYQEYFEECNQIYVKNENVFESYTVRYLDENKDYACDEGDESDYFPEKNDGCSSDEVFDAMGNYLEELDNPSALDKPENSFFESKTKVNKWLTYNYVEHECPECKVRLNKYVELKQHLRQSHQESIEEADKCFFNGGTNCGVCKECGKAFSNSLIRRYFHSLKHGENDSKLEINMCKICNFKTKSFFVQKHILANHPEVLNEFKNSSPLNAILRCPLCPYTYKSRKHIWYHFTEKHPKEYENRTIFTCHLCEQVFHEENPFLLHLAENHKLNSWNILNYRKVVEDKEFVACTECGSLFFQNDTLKLLKHFLRHESNSFWTCKFCSKKTGFKTSPLRHMCLKIIEYFNERNYGPNDNLDRQPKRIECHIKNLQDFEKYVAHVCPFCNKDFSKMMKWQQHLKKVHFIETLKGLEMKIVNNENSKLRCEFCHALVANSPEKLHAHRFQHLPFKPYKCLLCSCALNTFKMAVDHVMKSCKEGDSAVRTNKSENSAVDVLSYLQMKCILCKHKQFHDVKSTYKHYAENHNNFDELFYKNSDNSMTCKICYKQVKYNVKNPYYLHIVNHFDEKTFQCKLCFKSYPTFKSANTHFLNHPGTKFLCQEACGSSVNNPTAFYAKKDNSKIKVTSLASSSIKSHVLNEFADFIGFVCPECNEDMGTQAAWHSHIATQHDFFNESNIYYKDADGSLKCTSCDLKLPTALTQQQKHRLTHMPYKSFVCNLCYSRFYSLGVLYQHFRRQHFAKGSFVCPLCSETLETSHQRTQHLKEKHPRNKWPDTMCSICYKIFSSPSAVRSHMRSHDIERFKHTCEICNAKLVELRDFQKHMEKHKEVSQAKVILHKNRKLPIKAGDCQSNGGQKHTGRGISKNEKRKLNRKDIKKKSENEKKRKIKQKDIPGNEKKRKLRKKDIQDISENENEGN